MTQQSGPYIQTPTDPQVLNLGIGQPSPSLLPVEALSAAAKRALGSAADPLLMQYGAKRGYAGFLSSLSKFLSRGYGVTVGPDELMVTGGISQALGLVSDVLGRRSGVVVTGDPTYFLARGIFESAGLRVEGVAVDDRGLDVDALARRLDAGLVVDFVYCIPTFHNPSSVTLDPARAARLVDLAQARDFIVVADEPYVLLNFSERPACMMSYDAGRGRVLSLGSFSKILGPGLRLGWAHAADSLVERLSEHGVVRSGGGLNPVVSVLAEQILECGFVDQHIRRLQETLCARATALEAALRSYVPQVVTTAARGGYFLWLDLGSGVDAEQLDARARAEFGVGFTPGPRCAVERDLARYARVSFSFYDEQELNEAARRLGQALR